MFSKSTIDDNIIDGSIPENLGGLTLMSSLSLGKQRMGEDSMLIRAKVWFWLCRVSN